VEGTAQQLAIDCLQKVNRRGKGAIERTQGDNGYNCAANVEVYVRWRN
jgi:hypothetical protein